MIQIRHRGHLKWARGVLVPLLILPALVLTGVGCRESRIRAYEVPAESVAQTPPMSAPPETTRGPEIPHWQLPAGWTEQPGTGMRFATVIVEAGDPPLEIRVTPLTMAAGDLLDNVNRWRQQLGLEPVSAVDVGKLVKSIQAGGRTIDYVNLEGKATGDAPARQILAGILPGSEQLWFFLMFDETVRVARHADEFEAFLGTVHLAASTVPVDPHAGHDHAPGEDHTAETPASAAEPDGDRVGADETMSWTLPAGWAIDPTPRDMRVATIKLTDGAGEVAITKFGGSTGDLLSNINRWRRQLELPPVATVTDQPSEAVEVADHPARLYDMAKAGSDAGRDRTMVVGLSRHGMSWFIKMTGPYQVLGREDKAFRQFLGTVRMTGSEAP